MGSSTIVEIGIHTSGELVPVPKYTPEDQRARTPETGAPPKSTTYCSHISSRRLSKSLISNWKSGFVEILCFFQGCISIDTCDFCKTATQTEKRVLKD